MFSGTRQFEPATEIDGRICWHLLRCNRLGFGTSPSSRETGFSVTSTIYEVSVRGFVDRTDLTLPGMPRWACPLQLGKKRNEYAFTEIGLADVIS
jgi:hypothetical protein